jgi:peptidoglycan/xylan/chitin deacetylase (PgdA/CDA1 family)
MKLLKLFGFKGLSIRQLNPYLRGEKKEKVVGITFDDGYQNNLINAAPILEDLDFSATCYLVSDRIGLSNVWDSKHGITQRPLMNHLEVQKWLDMGMDIGAHSSTHADLTSIDIKNVKNEIQNSKLELEKKFNIEIKDFCYPYGRHNDLMVNMVGKEGFDTATTMIRGKANLESNLLRLPRIPITNHTLPHLFLAKLFTNYENNRT